MLSRKSGSKEAGTRNAASPCGAHLLACGLNGLGRKCNEYTAISVGCARGRIVAGRWAYGV